MYKFQNPEYFLLIILIPFIIFYYNKLRDRLKFSYSVGDLIGRDNKSLIYIRNILNFLILLFLILSLANFQKVESITNTTAKGINILIALDSSGSMSALDFHRNGREMTRLNALKLVVNDFINKRPDDKIGLVVFGKEAFTQCPLTIDHETLHFLVNRVTIGMAGDSTAIGSAILLSIKRLKDVKSKSKIIILVTDGRNNSGQVNPIIAAKLAKEFGIKIYTIGIGSKGKPVPILRRTPFGLRKIYVNVDLDDFTLKQIAKITGGKYYNAQNFQALESIINDINKIEKTKFKIKKYVKRKYLYYYFLIVVLILLIFKLIYFHFYKIEIP